MTDRNLQDLYDTSLEGYYRDVEDAGYQGRDLDDVLEALADDHGIVVCGSVLRGAADAHARGAGDRETEDALIAEVNRR